MSTVICNTSFACSSGSFAQGLQYDTTQPWVSSATALFPEHFYATGGSKTCNNAFVMKDSRGGGFERFVRVGEQLPSGDAAVTAAPSNFS